MSEIKERVNIMANEKIIQVTTTNSHLYSLTNHGRLFVVGSDDVEWSEIPLPPLNKTKPRAQAKESAYSEDFEKLWSIYPDGAKGSKKAANAQYVNRISLSSYSPAVYIEIEEGIKKYKSFIESTGQYLMHMSKFIGKDEHYLNDYTIPDSAKRQNRVKQEWEIIPENDNHLAAFIEKHGFKQGHDRMDKVFDTRRKLQAQIKQRIERELN